MAPRAWSVGAALVAVVVACVPQDPVDEQPYDAGVTEAEAPDAGEPPDAGFDAGVSEDAGTPDAGPVDAGLGPISFEVSSGELIPRFSRNVTAYSLSSFTTLEPVTVTVHGTSFATVAGTAAQNDVPVTLPSMAVVPNAGFNVTLDGIAYTVKLLPPDFPRYTVVENNSAPGRIYLAPAGYLLILNHTGETLFSRKLQEQAFDFKRHVLPGGTVRYSYLMDGDAHVLDDRFRELATYRIVQTANNPSHIHGQHDFEILGPDHVLVQADILKTVHNIPAHIPQSAGGTAVIAAVVQELKDGNVIFEWSSTDHPELYELSVEGNDFVTGDADYAHLNSVEIDPYDGHLVMSFRHLDAVLKVDRLTGAILWRLGGPNDSFGTPPEDRPSHQHTAQMIGPSRLLLYDNGNAARASRVMLYSLDVPTATLAGVDEFPVGYFSFAMGSVQQLEPGVFLLGLGAALPLNPDVLEIDRNSQTERFRLTFNGGQFSYRAYKGP